MNLSQLLYMSDATEAMSQVALERVVKNCQRNNTDCNLTGLLLYSAGHFIQLLEGHQPVVANLFAKIGRDTRHHNVRQLYFGACNKRLFTKWQMGLLNLDGRKDLDAAGLLKGIDLLTRRPDAATILAVFREFRAQLPAKSDEIDRAA